MRIINRLVLTFCLGLAAFGCGKEPGVFEGPKVDAFYGKVVHNGKPVKFAEGEEVSLSVFHETGRRFGIPLKEDGTFEVGWMPTGKYNVQLERTPSKHSKKGASKSRYGVPDGMNIEAGKTDYVIELGKNYKP